MSGLVSAVSDKITQWQVYNYQKGDAWAWFLNAANERRILYGTLALATFLIGLRVFFPWGVRKR